MDSFLEIHKDFVKIREATKQGYAIAREGDSINLEQPNSKTRRGRVGKQIANTLTCSCNQGVVEENKRRDDNMWKNELEKFNFKMDEIKLFDSFAGKGALHKALKKLGVPTKVIGLSEIEPDAIIAYAGVHIKDFANLDFDYPSDDEMKNELMSINVGWDFTKQKSSISRMKKKKKKLLYKANKLTNNFGDISILDYPNLPDFDLFNFSFPCTDISNAGKQKGLKNEDGTHTRSGLVKFGIDLIKVKKPKYIMIENVKALIQKKFINDFYGIIDEIESYGYTCFYPTKEDKKGNISPTCLNAKDYGIPQNRERIFVICIRNDINLEFEFPKGFDKGIRLKDLLEDNIDEKYYLSEVYNERFKESLRNEDLQNKIPKSGEIEVIGTTQQPNEKGTNCRHWVHNPNKIIGALSATEYKQPKQIIDEKYFLKKTKDFFIKNSLDMEAKGNGFRFEPHVKENAEISKCVTTRAGARMDDNYIIYDTKSEKSKITFDSKNCLNNLENLKIRKLTPLCCWRLMGFDDEDFYHTKELGLSDSSLYKLAGNSIVVNCLYYIFKEVFKEYIIK
ncbi:DNA (cytosine-5-)-methyltransferase [Clostridium perfringens]|uniref:DNA (cytosine-5-)-methyltransferase n=1 Tax=Clostridium perfringens TaxID=1502 RepID=UPI00070FCB57|nr:DNA (cytosine-5-)-methyltransferase [Clostridium perfringens]